MDLKTDLKTFVIPYPLSPKKDWTGLKNQLTIYFKYLRVHEGF